MYIYNYQCVYFFEASCPVWSSVYIHTHEVSCCLVYMLHVYVYMNTLVFCIC